MITKRNDLLSQKVIQGLKNRHMNGYYVHTKQEAFDLVFELMKSDSSVGWGGSDTINSLGIKEELYKRDFKVIDRDKAKNADEKYNIERETFLCRLLFNEHKCNHRRWYFSKYGWTL